MEEKIEDIEEAGKRRKNKQNMKKRLTKRPLFAILRKNPVRESKAKLEEQKVFVFSKTHLTGGAGCGRLRKLSKDGGGVEDEADEKVGRKMKKVLDKGCWT